MKFFSAAYYLYSVSVTAVQAIPPPITEVLESSAKALAKGVDSISMTSSNNLESSVDDVIGVSLKNKQKIDTSSSPLQKFAATRSPENIEIDNIYLNIVKLLETSDKAPAKGVDSLSTTSSSTFKSILDDANEGPLKKKQKLETVLQARNTDIVVPSAPVKAPRVVGRISSSEHLPVRNLDSTKSESLQISILDDANEGPLKKKQKLETVLQARNTDIEVPSAPVKAPRVVGRISSSEHLPVRNLDSTNSESLQIEIDELLNDFDHLDLKIANPL